MFHVHFACLFVSTISALKTLGIDYSKSGEEIREFWSSTGMTPQDPCNMDMVMTQLLSEDFHTNIIMIGSLPNKAIKQVLSFLFS